MRIQIASPGKILIGLIMPELSHPIIRLAGSPPSDFMNNERASSSISYSPSIWKLCFKAQNCCAFRRASSLDVSPPVGHASIAFRAVTCWRPSRPFVRPSVISPPLRTVPKRHSCCTLSTFRVPVARLLSISSLTMSRERGLKRRSASPKSTVSIATCENSESRKLTLSPIEQSAN